MTNSHPTNTATTPDQTLTPTLFEQIQSLFLLKNTALHALYTQFQLSLTVLFSILHDHTTQTLRRAIDEHTYLCAQRAHLELILETENVAIALAKTENPTQEQRRRLGTLNATLKTSFKHLQQLRGTLLNDNNTTDHTDLAEPHTAHKPTHTKRTTTRRTPTHTTTHTNTIPTPTPVTPNPPSTYSNTPNTTAHTNSNLAHTAPTHTTTPTNTHSTHNQPANHPTNHPVWTAISPHLSPEARQIAHSLSPDIFAYLLSTHQHSAAEILEAQAARNRAALQQLTTQRTTTQHPQPALT